MRSFSAIALAGLLCSCASPAAPVAAPADRAAPEPPREHSRLRAPYVLTLEGPQSAAAGERVRVVARLELRAPAAAPIELAVEAPEDLARIEGALTEELPAGTAGTIERAWDVTLLRDGATVAVRAAMKGGAFGASARKELRFGGPDGAKPVNARPGAILQPAD